MSKRIEHEMRVEYPSVSSPCSSFSFSFLFPLPYHRHLHNHHRPEKPSDALPCLLQMRSLRFLFWGMQEALDMKVDPGKAAQCCWHVCDLKIEQDTKMSENVCDDASTTSVSLSHCLAVYLFISFVSLSVALCLSSLFSVCLSVCLSLTPYPQHQHL